MGINRHEALGVSAIDLMSMVVPRTIIDTTRNPQAGLETAIREGTSTTTNAAIGLAGLGAAILLALGLKHKNYNVDFKSITANDETIEQLAQTFKSISDANPNATKKELANTFLSKIFEDVKGIGGNSDTTSKEVWYRLKPENKKAIVDTISEQLESNKSFKLPAKLAHKLEGYLNFDIPSTQDLRVNLNGKELATKGEHFVEDAYTLTKSFLQDNVLDKFKKSTSIADNLFIQDLKKLTLRKTGLGLAAISAIALSTQAVNRYLTQKRTGKKGFVGDPDYDKKQNNTQEQKDRALMPLKLVTGIAIGSFIIKTINPSSIKDFLSKIQFKGSLPTVNQIKVIYGATILGRLAASSDRNELRESAFRDFLGFTNFLVIGPMLTKLFVNWKDKSLINYDAKSQGKGLLNWIKNASIKTHEEVINSTLKEHVFDEKGTIPIKQLYKNGWIKPHSNLAEKLNILNKARLLGMAYACVALGIAVPLINKYMTEKSRAKKPQPIQMQIPTAHLTPEQVRNAEKIKKVINNFLHSQGQYFS